MKPRHQAPLHPKSRACKSTTTTRSPTFCESADIHRHKRARLGVAAFKSSAVEAESANLRYTLDLEEEDKVTMKVKALSRSSASTSRSSVHDLRKTHKNLNPESHPQVRGGRGGWVWERSVCSHKSLTFLLNHPLLSGEGARIHQSRHRCQARQDVCQAAVSLPMSFETCNWTDVG